MITHCTNGECGYSDAMFGIAVDRPRAYRGAVGVYPVASVWERTQLLVGFRFVWKKGPCWDVFCQNERSLRSKHVLAIPNKCFATFGLGSEFLRRRWASLTAFCNRLEVWRGFLVELQPVFSNLMHELIDPEFPWWVVAYTKLEA